MKSIVILLFAFASCGPFLRQLAITKIDSFDKTCITAIGTLTATFDGDTANGDYVLGEQTKTQKIERDTKTFTVKFTAFKTAPKIFANITSTKEIPCTADDGKVTLTCTPTTT